MSNFSAVSIFFYFAQSYILIVTRLGFVFIRLHSKRLLGEKLA